MCNCTAPAPICNDLGQSDTSPQTRKDLEPQSAADKCQPVDLPEIKRRPGGYGGWVGQKHRPSKTIRPSNLLSSELEADRQRVAETYVRTITVDGESYTISEDGCLMSGYIVSWESPAGN
jgi:hypothetical protein